MASDSERGLIPRVNFFDGQKVTESDMDAEQIYNRSVLSGIVKDFHGSGVLWEDMFNEKILLDTRTPNSYSSDNSYNFSKDVIEQGSYDGRAIYTDAQPSDAFRGNRLEYELSDSMAEGRNFVSVLVIGWAFDGIDEGGQLVSEFIHFRENGKKVSEYYYLSVIAIFFNNFSGGTGRTELESSKDSLNLITETSGKFVIREAGPLVVYPQSESVYQITAPNIYFRDFITSDESKSIEDEIRDALGNTINFNDLYFELEPQEQLSFDIDGDNSVAFGQKFLSKSNNLQRIDILLSVEKDEEQSAGHEYDFSGDLVISVYELSTDTNCPTDVVPDNLIDFDPDLSPIMEISYSQDDLLNLGYKLDDTPREVGFDFSGTLIADPNIDPSLESNKYYAFMVSRRGDNRTGTVLMEKGFDQAARKDENSQNLSKVEQYAKQETRYFEFDPRTKKYVDDYSSSLWFVIHTDSVEVTNGLAYSEDGFLITIPKTETYIGGTEISKYHRNIPLADVSEGTSNYIVLTNSNSYTDPNVHPRTGNFIYTRVLDSASISSKTESELEELFKDSNPILLSEVIDNNVRDFEDISDEFDVPGLYLRNKIYLIEPSATLLASNLINMVFTPDVNCDCTSRYRISSTRCYDMLAGDIDGDGELTISDISHILGYVGNTINSETTERKILGGELDILSFIKSDLNADDTVDGFDIELLEDAIDGYTNFTIEERIRVLEISIENVLEEDDFPIIFEDTNESASTTVDTSTIEFLASTEEEALILRPGDIVHIPYGGDDYGSYIILTKSIDEDGLSVTITVSDMDGDVVYFSGSSGFDIEILSGTATNILADNHKLSVVPYESKTFSISYVEAPYSSRFMDVCDLRRFVETSFLEEDTYGDCECVEDDCETPDPCAPKFKNQHLIPHDLYIPNGEIYSSPGIPYHGDFEYSLISIPLPPGSIEDCQINLYETFIKSDGGECITSAGYPALVYSDGTYVGCEDSGSWNDLAKNRVKISHAIASLHVDSFLDGYAVEDGYEAMMKTSTSEHSEFIMDSFKDYSYNSFETWVIDYLLSDLTRTTILQATGPNEPAELYLLTTSDTTPRLGKLDGDSDISGFSGDFVIDMVAFRSAWPESSLISGRVMSYSMFEVSNSDSTSAILKLGWIQHGTNGAKLFYSGEIFDSSGLLASDFYYEVEAPDSVGDEVMLRLRRVNDVSTAMYFVPSKIDYTLNPTGQYIRIGENPEVHPGTGDVSMSLIIEQDLSPTDSLSFAVKYSSVIVQSDYISVDNSSGLIESSTVYRDSSNNVQNCTISFPVPLTSRTSIVSAYINLVSSGTTSTTDLFNVIPLDIINADNLGRLYNYPIDLNESITTPFRPDSAADGETISIDITSIMLSMLSEAGHLPGYVKAFIIEPDVTAASSFSFYLDGAELEIEFLDTTTGIIFKVGIKVDPETGIASFKTKNILYDTMIEENRTVVEFGVYLKKSGFKNDNVYIGFSELSRIGIGTCTDESVLLEEDECFFIAGSTATGTFVEGPFPCYFHLPPVVT